jgi:hypothetical protein
MLHDLFVQLSEELSLPVPKEPSSSYTLLFSKDISIEFQSVEPYIYMHAHIMALPKEVPEVLLIHLMKANLLGQGTGRSVIGIDQSEKFLTLSTSLPYEVSYGKLKESLEDFINYLIYWKKDSEKILEQTKKTIYS